MDELLSVKELASKLGRSEKYVRLMKLRGFGLTGGRATLLEAREFLRDNPNPCSRKKIRRK